MVSNFVQIDDSCIKIKGVQSSFVGPDPDELGVPKQPENNKTTPNISNRNLSYK